MSFLAAALAGMAIMASAGDVSVAASSGPGITVRAAYDDHDGHWLRMELENRSSEPISMTNSFLPWGSTFSTVLMAVVATDPIAPAPSIDRNRAEDNPVGSEITIQGGETLRGSIDLDWQFPTLKEWTSRGEVIVFWSYAPRLRDGRKGERVGGFIVVPEKGSPKDRSRR